MMRPITSDALADDFIRITTQTVFCTATTVDDKGGRGAGCCIPSSSSATVGRWAGRSPAEPLKATHLAANPHMCCSYWSPFHDTVFVDCVAGWVEDSAEKQEVWDLVGETPPPSAGGPTGSPATEPTAG
jgi:hypothetical protein